MNSGQRMAHIACGAALENVVIAAQERGWNADVELPKEKITNDSCPLVARVRLSTDGANTSTYCNTKYIGSRATNRRLYDARSIDRAIVDKLLDRTPVFSGVTTHWITARDRMGVLADLIARGDATMFGEPLMRRAFLSKVRFDLPANAEAEQGLPLAALEVSATESIAMQSMKIIPNAIFKLTGGKRIFAAHARNLVRSSSGVCVIAANGAMPHAELFVGRAMQRAWLALTEFGLAAQPMMSLPVLENALRHGEPELVESLLREKTDDLVFKFNTVLQGIGISGHPSFLLRFGYAQAPSGRTGRLNP
jgi:nitroreductase